MDKDGQFSGAPYFDAGPSTDNRGKAWVMSCRLIPEFRAEMVAILPTIAGIPIIIYRRRRKSLSYVGINPEEARDW